MKAGVLAEPEIEFELGRHIDIRHGLAELGPLDRDGVRRIEVGIVGSAATRDGVARWIEGSAGGIQPKGGPLPNLFPAFPGFSASSPFSAEAIVHDRLSTDLPPRAIEDAIKAPDPAQACAELIAAEIRAAISKGRPDVIVVAVPPEVLAVTDEPPASDDVGDTPEDDDDVPGAVDEPNESREDPAAQRQRVDLRDYLKAIALPTGVPLQLIRPTTYGMKAARPRVEDLVPRRSLQDEATRAWNFFVALYYKASGTPWRLPRPATALATCYVGVSFFRTPDASTLQTAMAQVFNERGQGVVIRGGPARQDKDDRVPHVDADGAYSLLKTALSAYRAEHRTSPARVVVHKSSSHDNDEIEGFTRAARDANIEVLDLVAIGGSPVRLMRIGAYPVLRGTFLEMGNEETLLYTRGSVPFFETYPGLYVPRPIRLRFDAASTPARALAEEALALTKMNWNNTQFDGAIPITLRAAREVGKVLRYIPATSDIQSSYAFYM